MKLTGAQLNAAQRAAVLAAYPNRDTTDSPWSETARRIAGRGPATKSDREWIDARTWEVSDDGMALHETDGSL